MKITMYVINVFLSFVFVAHAAEQTPKRLKEQAEFTFKEFTYEQRQEKSLQYFFPARKLFIDSLWEKQGTYEQWQEDFSTGIQSAFLNYVEIYADKKRLVGVMLYQPTDPEGGVYLRDLAVAKDCQGQGVGTCAINYLKEKCQGRSIWLNSVISAEGFYEKIGFIKRDSGAFELRDYNL